MAENGAEIARAYVLVVPSTQGAQKQLTQELVPQATAASEVAGEKSGSAFASKLAKGLAAGAAAVTAAAATMVAGLVATARDVAALGDTIDKQSQKVGLSYEAYQQWDYAMQLAGTSMQACTTGLKTLTNKFDDAIHGSEGAVETFERLGLSMEEIQGLSREDLFKKVVKSLQNVTDETKKAALANDLFGKSGQDLLPLFNMTNEELDAVIAETEQYGMIMSDTAVKDAAAFTDSLTRLQLTMRGLKTSMVSEFLPGMTLIADGFSGMVAGSEDGADMVAKGVAEMVGKLSEMAPKVIDMVGKLFPQVATVILDNLPTIIDAVFNTLDAIIDFLLQPDTIETVIGGVISIIMKLIDAVPRFIDALVPAIPDIVTGIIDGFINNMPDIITGVISIITALLEHTPEFVTELIKAVPDIVNGLVAAFQDKENQEKLIGAGKEMANALWQGIKALFPKDWWKLLLPGFGGFLDLPNFGGNTSPSSGAALDLGGYDFVGSNTTNIYTGDVAVTANSATGFAAALRSAAAMG